MKMFKTSMKRAALCAFLVMATMLAYAQNFTYNYRGVDIKCKIKDGQAIVIGFKRDAAKVVIPANVQSPNGKSYVVTTLDLYSEAAHYKTNAVAIEKGITKIEKNCFAHFSNLETVYIPATIELIGKKAFNPRSIPKFNMPSTIKESDLIAGLTVYPKVEERDAFADVDFNDFYGEKNQKKGTTSFSENIEKPKVAAGTSDVDYNIPTTNIHRENTFCVIIANENYENAPSVDYAISDGETFRRYCTNTLGIPSDNIHYVADANYLGMQEQLDWMKKVADVFGNDANFIVYYAGHGIPGDDGACYLLPVEGSPDKTANGYALHDIYNSLSQITTKSALMIVDACFSGSDRSDISMYTGEQRGIVRKVREEKVSGNVVVLSAAANTETSMSYEEKGHGMFTYYLLKKLQESKGNVTYGELYSYVNKEVRRRSVVSKGKTQTPSVIFSDRLVGKWENLKF